MKKLFLSLIVIAATAFGASARTSLAEAYKALSGLAGMTEQTNKMVDVGQGATITNMKTSSVSVAANTVQDYRNHMIWELENLPVRKMVVGANNQRELASIYAEPIGGGKYNVLIVLGNALGGQFSASYGQTTQAGINALRNCNVSMDADGLTMTAPDSDPNAAFISMTD